MKRHPLDPFSLVFGIAFTALGGTLLNTEIDIADLSGRWLLPLPFLLAGLIAAAVGLTRLRATEPVPDPDNGNEAEVGD